MTVQGFPDDVRAALSAYRTEKTAANWTALSQMSVGDTDVLDALQALKPDFPEPYPLPVEDVVENSAAFFQWPELPEADDVERAIENVLKQGST